MKTPAGIECEYFYGNYFRGQSTEECRLIGHKRNKQQWTRDLCSTCPVPKIKLANACKHMILHATVNNKWLGMKKFVEVSAYCTQSQKEVTVPEIGCGECHPIQEIYNNIAE